MAYQLPCNVLKCGYVSPKEDKEYLSLKKMMTESPSQFKAKINNISHTDEGYCNVLDYVQRDPDEHESLLKLAILFKIFSIIQ
jgi:uncharacterized membrane protein YcgQ (UPF0703/DUF1980 family)